MELALGTMNFGKRTDAGESARIMGRALEAGITLFDTANVYNGGESERIVGRFLKGQRGRVRLASKVGIDRVDGKPEGLSKAAISRALDASLERLGTDYLDIYYMHAPDYTTPIEESVEAMATQLGVGKIRALGISNFASWQVLEVFQLCDARGIARPVISQLLYNMLVRQLEHEYFRFAARYQLHTTVFNSLAGGLLSGKAGVRFDNNPVYQRRYLSDRFSELVAAYGTLAQENGMSLVELSYGWVAGRPGVGSILVGPASVAHLDAALAGCAKPLFPALYEKTDALYRAFQGTDACYAR